MSHSRFDSARRAQPARKLHVEPLEARRLLAVSNLTTLGAQDTVNGAIFKQYSDPSGIGGVITDSFLQIRNDGTEQGYNTGGAVEPNTLSATALQLADVPIVVIDGVDYREFVLDIAETDNDLSLDQLRFYVEPAGNMTNLPTGFGAAVYDLGAGNSVRLNQALSGGGNGRLDMVVLVPSTLFGTNDARFVYLFSRFGDSFSSSGGVEEWAVASPDTPATSIITGYKFNDLDRDGTDDGGTDPRIAGVTIFLDTDNSGTLTTGDFSTTTSATGEYVFSGLTPNLYRVREVVPVGFTRTTGNADINVEPGTIYLTDAQSTGVIGVEVAGLEFGNARLGSISWEKRREDNNSLQGGATFSITPNPLTGSGALVIVDGDSNDADPDPGQIRVNNVQLGTFTIAETASPTGFALDDDVDRLITVSIAELDPVVGTQGVIDAGNTDESDFFNRLGSIAWEKRREDTNALQGGATFTISPNPLTGIGTLTVVDNGADDTDPDPGQILIENARLDNYLITETVSPAGFAIDDDPTRAITVSSTDLDAVVGTQTVIDAGNTDESDFFNRLGTIAWEKRREDNNALLAGATFTISPNPLTGTGTLTVVDNGAGDADPDAGQIQVNAVLLGVYTITETASPAGFGIDDNPTRTITVNATELNPVVGTQGMIDAGNTNESDFFNPPMTIAWEKRREDTNALLAGATFTITPNPLTGTGALTVVDNGPGDADLDDGQIQVNAVLVGTYTITETVSPAGFALDDDPIRVIVVSAAERNPVVGTQGVIDAGDTDESDFFNRLGSIAWEKRREDNNSLQGGATFVITPSPLTGTGTLTVVDNGAGDADPDAGQIQIVSVLLGAYTITETVSPAGFALDDDVTRSITVSSAELNPVVGAQGADDAGNSDESDFHNRLGSIAWEKRREDTNALQGGATFSISPNPLTGSGTLVIVDGDSNDADPDAGQIQVNGVLLGVYTITETASPAGFGLDNDVTRAITVSGTDLNAVVGTQGVNDAGDTDESDFHNPPASIAWEKRREDDNTLQGGATFSISPNPLTGNGALVIVDGDINDADSDPGQIQINNVLLGVYTITETVSPAGFALDDDVTRLITVSLAEINPVVGTQGLNDAGNSDESDFHNRLGSIAWEKRREDDNTLQGGAAFSISPNPRGGIGALVITDGDINDADPDPGQMQINNVLLGDYVITETVSPAGFALDDDTTRAITVSGTDLNAVVGTQGLNDPGDTDESDFHNRLGSIAWEKRREDTNVLQGGATFRITPNPLTGSGFLDVLDNGAGDADPDAGQVQLNNVLLGEYTITETVAPPGFALDDDVTRAITVSGTELNPVVGTQGVDDAGNTDESDFHNPASSIAWEKRREDTGALQGGATFSLSPNPFTGAGTLTVVDNGAGDADPDPGQIQVNNVQLGAYTITETVSPTGFALDDDVTRSITVNGTEPNAIVGTQGVDDAGNTDESDFHNRLGSIAWEKRREDTGALQGGATFSISPNPLTGSGSLVVVDGDSNDADLDPGQIQIISVLLGAYTITETAGPAGFALDDDPTRAITVSDTELNPIVGAQGVDDAGNTDESDFHNRLGSIAWEKRREDTGALLAGATFDITPNPLTGSGSLTVLDNGPNDADPDAGQIQVNNVLLGDYTISEAVSPAGFALDDDLTRSITVSGTELNPVVGTQGVDDPGNTDESDFHNRLGSIAWEKRREDTNALQGGATFRITPNPATGAGFLDVIDNGPGDADPDAGQIQVNSVLLGVYTIAETASPTGFALDDDATRSITVSNAELNNVVGTQGFDDPGDSDESDFHNRLGSIAWEKRREDTNGLQGGATFRITPNPSTGAGFLDVIDNGAGDADPDAGQIQVNNVLLGAYTITETVSPAGFALDDDANRAITVSNAELNPVVGVQGVDDPGNSDESDFHNRLGSIAWEKRREDTGALLSGATFSISPNPNTGSGSLTVVDNGAGDSDPDAGQVQISNALLGLYTITETVSPAGFELDDDVNRAITVSGTELNPVVGTQGVNDPGNTDESDFHNRLGSIAWEKRREDTGVLLGGATFSISPNPLTGSGSLTVVDNGIGDADPDAGQIQLNSVLLGAYTITETVAPAGFLLDDDVTRSITVSSAELNPVVGAQGVDDPGNTDESDFHNPLQKDFLVVGSDVGTKSQPAVKVYDPITKALKFTIAPSQTYGASYRGGVRVATGDIDGDGTPDIVTAPARSMAPTIKVFSGIDGTLIRTITAASTYGAKFVNGVYVAVGDVDGDGRNDIVVSPQLGAANIKVFRNTGTSFSLYRSFTVFGDFKRYSGGATVAVADVSGDARAEVIVGSGPGIAALVRVYQVTATSNAQVLQIADPKRFTGGVYVAAGNVGGDGKFEIITASASGRLADGAGSTVRIYNGATGAALNSFQAFPLTAHVPNAPIRATVREGHIWVVQGQDGRSQYQMRKFNPLSGAQVDAFFAEAADSAAQNPGDDYFFGGGMFIG